MGLLSGIRRALRHGASKGHDDAVARINDHLTRQWEAYVASSLLARADESLFPTAARHTEGSVGRRQLLAYDTRKVSEDGGEPMPFRDFFQRSWAEGKQTHLFVTGEGGIGKTVSLLCFASDPGFLPAGTPAVYVPMHQLGKYVGSDGGCIDAFLRKAFSKGEHEELVRRAHEPWSGGPSLILLLDGYNEVSPGHRYDIEEDVGDWAVMPGTQVVVTSRIGGLHRVRTASVELLPLGRDVVERYLHKHGVDEPATGSRLWEAISTPLMLQLYADVELFRRRYGAARWLRLEPSDSAGTLIWNYLMRELYQHIEERRPMRRNDAAAYVDAVLLTLPYVCWHMEARQRFELGDDELHGLVRDACAYWRGAGTEPKRVGAIKDHVSEPTHAHSDDERYKVLVSILSDETGLLHWHAVDHTYTLMHQNFRDALAALHVRNAGEVTDAVPEELDYSLSEYVKDFLADLMDEDAMSSLWERNRLRRPTAVTSTHNLLRIVQARYDGDLGLLSFAGMDLRGLSLYGYRREGDRHLLLQRGDTTFQDTIVDIGCFSPQGHRSRAFSVCFSPNGRMCASGSLDGTVRLWDTGTRECLAEIGHFGRIDSVRFSPDGDALAFGCDDGMIRFWSVQRREQMPAIQAHQARVSSISFSPKGQLIASASFDGTVCMWDATDTTKCKPLNVMKPAGGRVFSVDFSSDGRFLAWGSADGRIRLWDIKASDYLPEIDSGSGPVLSIRFSPNGEWLASGSADCRIRVWDVETHAILGEMNGHRNCANSVCFSNNRGLLASASDDGSVRLWDIKNFRCIKELNSHRDWVNSVCFSPDGRLLASASDDGSVRLWDAMTHVCLHEMRGQRDRVRSVCFSPKLGHLIAVGSDDGPIRLWSTKTYELRHELNGHQNWVRSVSFSPSGRVLASGADDDLVLLWDVDSLNSSFLERPVGVFDAGCPVFSVCFYPLDERMLAFGTNNGEVRMWNTETRECLVTLRGTVGQVFSVAFSPDGRLLAAGGFDGVVLLWSLETLAFCGGLIGHRDRVNSVCFSPDSRRLASASDDGTVRLWDVMSLECVKETTAHRDWVNSVCFSADGMRLVSGADDGTVRLWDACTFELLEENNTGDGSRILSICFSPEGKLIASSSVDGPCRLWDAVTLREVHTIRTFYGIHMRNLDLSLAVMDDVDRKILLRNGVKVPPPGSMERYLATLAQSGKSGEEEGPGRRNETMPNIPQFKIGFTFTGRYRDTLVRPTCEVLLTMGYAEDDIFLDEWHEPLISRIGADALLQEIYHDHCDVVVVLLSPDYAGNDWTGHVEWRAVRNLINTGKAGKICLLRVGGADVDSIDGLYAESDIAMNVDGKSPERVARDIVKWMGYGK